MMERGAPESFGFVGIRSLSRFGRAERHACDGGELYVFRATSKLGGDHAVAERLLALGHAGIGGFFRGGQADDGSVWLVRKSAETLPTLSSYLWQQARQLAWIDALDLTIAITRTLEYSEQQGLFVGPLSPSSVVMESDRPHLLAEPLVAAMLGEGGGHGATDASASTRWMPPEQARGAAFDNAANRYVLGLLLYRLISGEHAFSKKGLRLALDEMTTRGAAPFDETIGRALPPGLQSLCLRILHPDTKERPPSARSVRESLEAIRSGVAKVPTASRVSSAPAESAPREVVSSPRVAPRAASRGASAWLPLVALAIGVVASVAIGVVTTRETAEPTPVASRLDASPTDGPQLTLLSSASMPSADCASCHPRQVAEWRRSVMAHSVRSPLFLGLESLIEEQVGRQTGCEHGAGILRGRIRAPRASILRRGSRSPARVGRCGA